MHADVKPTASASFLCVFPAFPLFGCNVCERETPTYLPHPGHSYFYADNGGPLVFVTPKTPFTASVCVDFYSCMRHKRKHGCGDIICGGRLHKCWSVPLFVSSRVFFPPWSCWDLDRRCAATGRRRRRAPPPPASRDRRWFPHFCFFSTCQCEERTYDFQYFHEQTINKNKWHMSISDTYSKCSKY